MPDDTITLTCSEAELPELLYLAYVSACLTLAEAPHAAPRETLWGDLDPADRQLWQETAKRLLALHRG